MVTDLLLVKLVHKHLNNDIEIINGLESVHPQKCMDKSKHNCSFWHLGSPSYGLQSLFIYVLRGMGEHIITPAEACTHQLE